MKRLILMAMATLAMAGCNNASETTAVEDTDSSRVVIAYVTSWKDVPVDPADMTHINYAFGHVADSFDSVRVDNPDRLRSLTDLKRANPDLKVILSVGGWGSGNFSEMAADSALRAAFAQSCLRTIGDFGLDGIDIDWEYPTDGKGAGISESPDDTENFTLLIRDLREALGPDRVLSIATVGDGKYVDLAAVVPYLDFVNVMAYDMGNPPYHHSALYKSPTIAPHASVSGCVEQHLALGVPKDKLVMGMPMYHRGHREVLDDPDVKILWDDTAKAPYAVMADTLALGMENIESVTAKCQYIKDQGLRGAMYWEYASEKDPDRPFVKTVKRLLIEK